MTIEELIPKLDDIYEDEKGLLHIDINLPCGDNYSSLLDFSNRKMIKPRIRELYDLSNYEFVDIYSHLDCYITTVWKRKENNGH